MNADYRFRAWDAEEKRFWYFTLQHVLERRQHYRGSWDEKVEQGEKTVCTGIQDQNGKDIYDGDFVLCTDSTINGNTLKSICRVFQYNTGAWCIVSVRTLDSERNMGLRSALYPIRKQCVVIGNRWETPELAEEQD